MDGRLESVYARLCHMSSGQESQTTRVVIDPTEFPIEKPANRDAQAATWSVYKNRNTLKALVGCSPNGAMTFISYLYGGCISNKELTKKMRLDEEV